MMTFRRRAFYYLLMMTGVGLVLYGYSSSNGTPVLIGGLFVLYGALPLLNEPVVDKQKRLAELKMMTAKQKKILKRRKTK